MKNKIVYGNGEFLIDIGESVVAFDILLRGKYELESYDIANFMMKYNNHRIIGVGIGAKLGKAPFLKYTGDLTILKCIAIKDNMEKVPLYIEYRDDKFTKVLDDFDGANTNFEDMNHSNVYGTIPNKLKVTFKNNKIYDKDGKKIDVNKPISKKSSKTTRRAMRNLRTMSTTRGGGY